MVDYLHKDRAISTDFIKEIHGILCHEAIESVPGRFKTQPNMVIGADFIPSPPYRVPMDMENWVLDLKVQLDNAQTERDIVESVCRQHFAFERIHPFSDGNGRVGRALLVFSCLQNGIVPIVIPVKQKQRYISCLNDMDLEGMVNFSFDLMAEEKLRLEAFGVKLGD